MQAAPGLPQESFEKGDREEIGDGNFWKEHPKNTQMLPPPFLYLKNSIRRFHKWEHLDGPPEVSSSLMAVTPSGPGVNDASTCNEIVVQ